MKYGIRQRLVSALQTKLLCCKQETCKLNEFSKVGRRRKPNIPVSTNHLEKLGSLTDWGLHISQPHLASLQPRWQLRGVLHLSLHLVTRIYADLWEEEEEVSVVKEGGCTQKGQLYLKWLEVWCSGEKLQNDDFLSWKELNNSVLL